MKKLDFNKMILNDSSPAQIREAYNTLRTNLCFSLAGEGAKVVGILSAGHGQGSSISALNLAISLSQKGKKVLLADADMHRSSLSAHLELKDASGLSDCLCGAELKSAVTSSLGIDILPCGSPCSNPANLFESKAAEQLFSELRSLYDFIILSLPPVGLVSDAAILSKYIDGFVLVVSHDVTKHRDITRTVRNLRLSDGKILGYLYNFAPVK